MRILFTLVTALVTITTAQAMTFNRETKKDAVVVGLTCSTTYNQNSITLSAPSPSAWPNVPSQQRESAPLRIAYRITPEACVELMAQAFGQIRCNMVLVDLITADNGVDSRFGIIGFENIRRNNRACL